MKTIVVLFHPNPENSIRNRQIQEQIQQLHNVTYHTISSTIDAQTEQALLKQFDRIVFQSERILYKNKRNLLKFWECIAELCRFQLEDPFIWFEMQKKFKLNDLKKQLAK
ncbi:glutathione-regulated_potassium-efflux system ancillary protein [Hexamita inflata]|uniref:Glutathione-regulated potassium-efflux system ancillary protein n=1 Tax=Hexamita inflata TaxID=28002 RepID=A0AA86R077_9EUKA|nr:glutathione-regulated potassium-efflux system ancillary protein [Hexamita inflata]